MVRKMSTATGPRKVQVNDQATSRKRATQAANCPRVTNRVLESRNGVSEIGAASSDCRPWEALVSLQSSVLDAAAA